MRQHAMQALHAGTVIPAMPLVLDASRHWDEVGQRRIIRYYLAAGVGGLAVAVHTTQFAIRKPGIDLFEPVLRLAMEEIAAYEERTGRVIVRIAGVCGPTPQAQREVRLAASLGYDAVLLSPGGLGAQEEAYLLERTREVAVCLPVIGFYLQPAVGGRVFTYDYWQALCQIDDVVAIKCAGFDRYLMMDVARAICYSPRAEKIAFYTGNDDNIVIDLLTPYVFDDTHKIRVVGGLLGHWAVWTHTAVRMLERIRATGEEMPRALLTLAAQVTDANAAFFDAAHGFAGCIAGIHEVLRRQGLMAGIWCLDPAETLSPGQSKEIDRVLRLYPHLADDEFVHAFLREEATCHVHV